MRIGGRKFSTILSALGEKRHYRAAGNMLRIYKHPLDSFKRYFFSAGEYPASISLKSPIGSVHLTTYSHHDILTINEIFCRQDYFADSSDEVVVDFGSNIGISAAYFLSRNPRSFAYLFEPFPQNTQRLKDNLKSFEGRYQLTEAAVALGGQPVEFGYEPTGRYGGVGVKTGSSMQVPSVDPIQTLRDVLARHGRIDILKIDIESMEKEIMRSIPIEIMRQIKKCYVEFDCRSHNLFSLTHQFSQYGAVAQFCSRTIPAA